MIKYLQHIRQYVTVAGIFVLPVLSSAQTTQTFSYTGTAQTWVVPPCVFSVTIDAYGAQGNTNDQGVQGGLGGRAQGVLNVTPGQTLTIYVGGGGQVSSNGGYNGGGTGGTSPCTQAAGGGGGGATDIRYPGSTLNDRVLVAGGGGGAGGNRVSGCGRGNGGGGGGGYYGGGGGAAWPGSTPGANPTGGTQTTGGTGGTSTYTAAAPANNGQNGALGLGGDGGDELTSNQAGSQAGSQGAPGGALLAASGTYAGNFSGQSGAGGSGYIGGVTAGSVTAGVRSGNGEVTITYTTGGAPPAQPGAITGNTTFCQGDTVSFSIATVALATSYTWTAPVGFAIVNGQGTTAITVVAGTTGGLIQVTADNVCGSSPAQFVGVIVNSLPVVTASAASGAVCVGSGDTLFASGGNTYVWSTGGTTDTEVVFPSSATTYTVIATDGNGCSSSATVLVNVNTLPVVSASAMNGVICFGESDTLMASGAQSYVWSSGGTSASEPVVPTVTTNYIVAGTDGNGCVNTDTIAVVVNALPVVSLGADIGSCGSAVVLDAQNAGSTYSWSSGATTQTDTVLVAGTYAVEVVDVNGCVNSDTINVTFNTNPTVFLGQDTALCGTSLLLDAQIPGVSYLWSTGDTTQTTVALTTGTYVVDVTDANGCVGSDTITVTLNPIPSVTATAAATNVCTDDANVVLTGTPVGGTWSGPGVSGNSFDPSVGVGTQVLTYSYTDSAGCSASDNVAIDVNACVGVEAFNLQSGVVLYPNPNDGNFNLVFNGAAGDVQIQVVDVSGRVVRAIAAPNMDSGSRVDVTMNDQPVGVYFMHIATSKENAVIKFTLVK
jgi:hypothetical protein